MFEVVAEGEITAATEVLGSGVEQDGQAAAVKVCLGRETRPVLDSGEAIT
ncbi:hypothetical protein [Streptomyces sp. NBC_01410]